MKGLILTGATGYIGSELLKFFNSNEIICFSRNTTINLKSEQFLIEDISNYPKALTKIDDVQTIIHLAALAHNKSDSIDEHLRVNYTEALNFAAKSAEQGCNKFIYLSTINVYGFNTDSKPFKEDYIGHGLDDISGIRLKFERSLLKLGRKANMQVIILRCPLVYSWSAPANFGKFLKLTSTSHVLPFGSFNAKRSYLCINNLLSAIEAVMDSKSKVSGVYNLSDGHDISMKEMSNLIANHHNIRPLQIYLPHFIIKLFDFVLGGSRLSRLFLTPYQVDSRKFRKDFSWKPIQTPTEYFTPLKP